MADIAQRLAGGHGYFEPYGIERYLRDFYGLVPIIGGQPAIETQVGDHVIWPGMPWPAGSAPTW